jgi:hypothetical protein
VLFCVCGTVNFAWDETVHHGSLGVDCSIIYLKSKWTVSFHITLNVPLWNDKEINTITQYSGFGVILDFGSPRTLCMQAEIPIPRY